MAVKQRWSGLYSGACLYLQPEAEWLLYRGGLLMGVGGALGVH